MRKPGPATIDMRLWSIHPCYLDSKGLVALWREALLAQKVLQGLTRGYRHHPQLKRFQAATGPVETMGVYLRAVADEADRRQYRFDKSKIVGKTDCEKIPVTVGQLAFELRHLTCKLEQRSPADCHRLFQFDGIEPHPLFYGIEGDIESWEVAASVKAASRERRSR